MKKLCLLPVFCVMMSVSMAQQARTVRSTAPSFYFGGGPTFSKFTGDGAGNAETLVGAQVALGIMWQLSNNFSIVPELNASMQGTKWDVSPKMTDRLWFLNVPVTARYRFPRSGFFAETGPQLGILLDAKRVINDNKTDFSDAYKTTSFNWVIGAGYHITENLAINARVAPGISDLDKNNVQSGRQFTSAVRLLFHF